MLGSSGFMMLIVDSDPHFDQQTLQPFVLDHPQTQTQQRPRSPHSYTSAELSHFSHLFPTPRKFLKVHFYILFFQDYKMTLAGCDVSLLCCPSQSLKGHKKMEAKKFQTFIEPAKASWQHLTSLNKELISNFRPQEDIVLELSDLTPFYSTITFNVLPFITVHAFFMERPHS